MSNTKEDQSPSVDESVEDTWELANDIARKIWEKRVYFRSVHKTAVVAIGEMARIINEGITVPRVDEAAVRRAAEKIVAAVVTRFRGHLQPKEIKPEVLKATAGYYAEIISTELKTSTTPLTDRASEESLRAALVEELESTANLFADPHGWIVDAIIRVLARYGWTVPLTDRAEQNTSGEPKPNTPPANVERSLLPTQESGLLPCRLCGHVDYHHNECPCFGSGLGPYPVHISQRSGAVNSGDSSDQVESSVPHQTESNGSDASKEAPKIYHCGCGAACTADEYIDHLFRGHDAKATDASKEAERQAAFAKANYVECNKRDAEIVRLRAEIETLKADASGYVRGLNENDNPDQR